jgi:hypothetical protein
MRIGRRRDRRSGWRDIGGIANKHLDGSILGTDPDFSRDPDGRWCEGAAGIRADHTVDCTEDLNHAIRTIADQIPRAHATEHIGHVRLTNLHARPVRGVIAIICDLDGELDQTKHIAIGTQAPRIQIAFKLIFWNMTTPPSTSNERSHPYTRFIMWAADLLTQTYPCIEHLHKQPRWSSI